MDIVPLAALASLVYTFINFLKYLTNREWKPAITIAIVWVAGVLAIFIAARTDFASQIKIIDNIPLDDLNSWSLLFTGLVIGSLGSVGFDGIKALDNARTGRPPGLFDKVGEP